MRKTKLIRVSLSLDDVIRRQQEELNKRCGPVSMVDTTNIMAGLLNQKVIRVDKRKNKMFMRFDDNLRL